MEPRGIVVKEAEGFQDLILEAKNKGNIKSGCWKIFAPLIPDVYIHGSLIPLINNTLIYHTYTQYSSRPIASTQRKHMETHGTPNELPVGRHACNLKNIVM